jgi:hypothetical protein
MWAEWGHMHLLRSSHARPGPAGGAPRRAAARATGAVVLAVVVLAGVPGCTKAHKSTAHPSASPSPQPSSTTPATANFSTQGVRAVDAQDRQSSNATANAALKQVISLVNTYYNNAFLQPSDWANGSFPNLSGLFTSDAAGTVAANLQTLSLGPLASQVARVSPQTETTTIVSVLIEPNGSASYATVTARFAGTTVPVGSAAPVQILQSAQFMIDASDYKIAGYDVSTSFAGQSAAASYTPTTLGGSA